MILDQFTGHTGEDIEKKASELNIQLIYVPIGLTSELQPLDIKINRVIKNLGHNYIKRLYVDDPYYIPDMKNAVLLSLIYAIKKLDSNLIKKSFPSIYNYKTAPIHKGNL